MFGWRARIGLILPADNVVAEPELYSLRLPGVSFHSLRLSATEHAAMRAEAVAVAGTMTEMGVDIVVYACAETSFDAGDGERERLSSVIRSACDVPVGTATGVMLEALTALGSERVALVSPYRQVSGVLLEQTLKVRGYEVVGALHRDFGESGTDPREWYETNRQSANTVYDMLRSVESAEADAVMVFGTNLSFLSMIGRAERELGKPVLATNQCILWWCLRELGLSEPVEDLGVLVSGKL